MRLYKVISPVLVNGSIHKAGEFLKVSNTSVASKYDVLEKTTIVTPTERCFWCERKGLPGNEFWLNHRGIYKCVVCFAPESFPRDDIMRVVYDRFTLEKK